MGDGRHLSLVLPGAASPAEEVHKRVRRMARPDGMCQCNRCGGRAMITITAGVVVKNGRKQGGTVIEKDICAECWKRGVVVSMLPELRQVP